MKKQTAHAISPTRAQDYPKWYLQVIQHAGLAENAPVRGCMIIKPWGYAIWENIQRILDDKFKETGHENVYFPLLIPLSYLQKEAEHVSGFAKECAVVTHQKLIETADGQLEPANALEEPLIIRPTSESMMGVQFAKWIQSYRDLPLLINQWANVMRWEMRTRLFLRTSEFLWQEGHTAHATRAEAIEETLQMLKIYADFAENSLAMPVIQGEKTAAERFPGADNTYTIEAMMQDKKALQAGTSHFLGQNFAKSFDILYTAKSGQTEYVWTTSWGASTRLIGGLIMTHSDDDGLRLPPKIAPTHVIILPIYRNDEEKSQILSFSHTIQSALQALDYDNKKVKVKIDKRDISGSEKSWQAIKKGIPIRLEIGPRDLKSNSVFMGRRDKESREKTSVPVDILLNTVVNILDEIQQNMYTTALNFRQSHSADVHSIDEFRDFFSQSDNAQSGGFASCYCDEDYEDPKLLKMLKVSARCISLNQDDTGTCIFTGKQNVKKIIFAKAY